MTARLDWSPDMRRELTNGVVTRLPWKMILRRVGVSETTARKMAQTLQLPLPGKGNRLKRLESSR